MIDEKHIELIHNEVDGYNSEAESAQVSRFIAANPEGNALLKELRKLSATLSQVPSVDPPEHLRHTIMNSIPRYKYAARQREWNFADFMAGIRAHIDRKLAYSLVAGAVAGLFVLGLFSGDLGLRNNLDPANLTGALVSRELIESLQIVDEADLVLSEGTVRVTTRPYGDLLLAEILVEARTPSRLALSFDQSALSVAGIQDGAGLPASIAFGDNKIVSTHNGDANYSIIFTSQEITGSTLSVRLEIAGDSIERTLDVETK